MKVNKSIEQHIAVFGESGSGKTVLLSSFYGPTQEPGFAAEHLYEVIATDTGQSMRLHQNYLGMRNSAQVPPQTRFSSHAYGFKVTPKASPDAKSQKASPVDHLRLVWHDYPGEWFEQDLEGEEAQRRIDTFRALMVSDVAFVLVDAQRLIDNAGEEERYLKSLFMNFRNGLERLKGDILTDGEPLVQFPRIWVITLSKADLLPDLDVDQFRELVVEKAGGEVARLKETIANMVAGGAALSVGEDFVRLSSATFEPGKIDLTQRIGLDLILPMAAMLPFERHAKWADEKAILKVPDAVIAKLHLTAGAVLAGILLAKKVKLPGQLGLVVAVALSAIDKDKVETVLNAAKGTLEAWKADALEKKNYFAAVLAEFRLALMRGEEQGVLRRSRA